MIHFREATPTDADAIAALHAQSWQRHYRGIWSDAFLDGPVLDNRCMVWQERLEHPADNQYVILAETLGQLIGFGCVFAEHDSKFGALLDNLHVSSTFQGHGIGKALLLRAAAWVHARHGAAPMYLWVLAKNEAARRFYDHLGGENYEMAAVSNPDGSASDCYRYVWWNVAHLQKPGVI